MQNLQTNHNTQQGRKFGYRKLDVEIKRPSKVLGIFWWVMGIAWAVLLLVGMLLAYLKQ